MNEVFTNERVLTSRECGDLAAHGPSVGGEMGVLVAVLGILRDCFGLAWAFWVTRIITTIWQTIPSCPLTDIEK